MTSSETIAVAPDVQTERDARMMLMASLTHHHKTGKWLTSNQMAQRDSWRGKEARRAARELLEDERYILVKDDGVVFVTPKGERWVRSPSVTPQSKPTRLEFAPIGSDNVEVMLFVENFHDRCGYWPTLTRAQDAGVRRRIGAERFNAAIEQAVEEGYLVRVMLRDDKQRFIRLIPVRWCPWFEGADGMVYWWDPARGPIEPE